MRRTVALLVLVVLAAGCSGAGGDLHGHSQQPGDASGASAGGLPTLVADKGAPVLWL